MKTSYGKRTQLYGSFQVHQHKNMVIYVKPAKQLMAGIISLYAEIRNLFIFVVIRSYFRGGEGRPSTTSDRRV